MQITCPKCQTEIAAESMNVATDVAVCSNCDEAFKLSSLVAAEELSPQFDVQRPPSGAWFRQDFRGWCIGASTRSATAFFLVPFMLVWSGFSLGGIYGTQIVKGTFSPMMSLFGIPFVIGTIFLGSIALMSVFGKVEVRVSDSEGRVFTGIGPIGWSRRFDWSKVDRIDEEFTASYRASYRSGSGQTAIALIGASRLAFGNMLSNARRYYVLQGLRQLRSER